MLFDNLNLAPIGWRCPVCGRVYSPTTSMCFYCGGKDISDLINPHYLKNVVNEWVFEFEGKPSSFNPHNNKTTTDNKNGENL